MTAVEDLRPGGVYRVSFDDCCVAGSFTSELAEIRRLSIVGGSARFEEDDGVLDQIVFANGVTLNEWGCVVFLAV